MAKHLQTWGTHWLYGGSSGARSGFDAHGRIYVYLDSQSQQNNTSSIYIDHYTYAQVTDTNLGVLTTISSTYRCNKGSFGGTYKTVSKECSVPAQAGEKSYYLGRTWHTITHNTDGTARLYVNGYISSEGQSTTSSFNVALPTIPRMSTMTATRANIGEVSQLTITQRNTAYTHSIKYQFGELTGYILADGTTTDAETKLSETSIGFTIPTSFYEQIPDAQEGTCTLTITTYNGDTQIGTAQIGTFVAEVANNVDNQPNLTVSVVDTNSKTKALTDVDTKLVRGYSTASVSYQASGNNFATITNVTINGVTATESPVEIPNFNAEKIEVIATDSRTFTTTKTPQYELINYFEPTISISAKRTAPTEDEIKLSFSGNVFNQSFGSVMNELSLSWVYRIRGEEEWTIGGTLIKDTDYVIIGNIYHSGTGEYASEINLGELFSYENNYEIGVVYSDKLFEPLTTVTTVSKGIPIINWNNNKVNVNGNIKAEGSVETSLLEIIKNGEFVGDISIDINGNILVNETPIVESGSNANGDYIKYANGDMIISQHYEVALSSTGAWGSLYGYAITNLKDYPIPFVGDLPSFVATFDATTANAWVCSKQETSISTLNKPCSLQLIRPTQNTPKGYLNIIAKGKWK